MFESGLVQSVQQEGCPQQLVLPFSQVMMSAALFQPDCPQRVLLLGLGAGSIVHFIHHHWQTPTLDALDYDEQVLGLAKTHFHLPPAKPGWRYLQADAQTFLAQAPEAQYDWVMVDLFDAQGMSALLWQPLFYQHCLKVLDAQGMLVMNLMVSVGAHPVPPSVVEAKLTGLIQTIRAAFSRCTFCVDVPGYENLILVAFKAGPPADLNLERVAQRARELSPPWGFDLSSIWARWVRV